MKLIALLLAIVTLFASLSVLSYAADGVLSNTKTTEDQAATTLDFSLPYAPKAYISPSDLLSFILSGKESLSDAEKEYLDGYFDEYLSYASSLPDSLVTTEKADGAIYVIAAPYSYETETGIKVDYLPVYLTVNGERHDLTFADGKYQAVISDTESDEIRVFYNGSLPLPEDTVNRLLNFTYNEAKKALAEAEYITEYNKALAEYNSYVTALEKYGQDKVKYEKYLSEKELYDKAYAAYEINLKEIEEYNKKQKEYESYLEATDKYLADLEQYKSDYANYEKDFALYSEYINNLTAIEISMTPIENIFKPAGNGMGSLFTALNNEEILRMLEKYRSTLVNSFGVKNSDIVYMRQYSDELKVLLNEYAEKRKISEYEAFVYYKENYERISYLFNHLYDKMNTIISPTIFNLVCGKIEFEYKEDNGAYKKKRLKNVIAATYLTARCLDDTVTVRSTWDFYADDGDKYTYSFSELLAQDVIITDSNKSNPSKLIWMDEVKCPDKAPTPPILPAEVERPIEPLRIPCPTAPEEVTEPTMPQKVEKPVLKEEYNSDILHRTGDILLLLEDPDSPLTLREALSDQIYYTTEISIVHSTKENISPTVTVYGRDGEIETFLTDISELSSLSTAEYKDGRTVYEFYDWSLSPCEYSPLPESLTESISVYRLYTAKARTYNITFSVNGKEIIRAFAAGELPTYDGISLHKESDDLYDYTFEYFYPPLRRVSENAVYTAQFASSDRIFKVTFNYANGQIVEKYVRGSYIDNYPDITESYFEGTTLYEFEKWDKPLAAVTEDVVYTAIYKETLLASSEDSSVSVSDSLTGYLLSGGSYGYNIGGLIEIAARDGKSITVLFEDGKSELFISPETVRSLLLFDAKDVMLLCERGEDGKGLCVRFTDDSGYSLSTTGNMRLRTPHSFDSDSDIYVRAYYSDGLKEEGIPSVSNDGYTDIQISANVFYKQLRKYHITISESSGGSVLSDYTLVPEGEDVTVYVYPNSGYSFDSVSLINNETGAVITESETTFKMPSYHTTVKVNFTPVKYKITFVYHNHTEIFYLELGQTPTAPRIPLSFSENGFFYTFIGWSSPLSTVTGDATYTAKYDSQAESEVVVNDRTAMEAIKQKYIIPVIIVASVLVAALIALIVFLCIRKKKKKKKGIKQNG